jgi:hypothetical protein
MYITKKFKVTISIKVSPVAITLFVSLVFSLFCLTILSCVCTPLQEATAKTSNSTSTTTAQANISSENFLIYEDLSDRFTIHYPIGWEKIEYPHNAIAELGRHIVVSFLSPLQGNTPSFRTYLQVEIVTKDIPSFNPESATASTLAGNPAYKETKINHEGSSKIERTDLWSRIGSKAYHITYAADETKYANYLPILQSMLNSFDITDFRDMDNSTSVNRTSATLL